MKKYFTACFTILIRLSVICIVLSGIFAQCAYCEDKLSVCFAGDLMLDRGVRRQIEAKDVDALFADVSGVFAKYDAVVVNLECPVTKITNPAKKQYVFRADPEWIAALKKAGITHAALANNHSADQGAAGLEDTVKNLKSGGIVPVGAGNSAGAGSAPVFIKKGKIKIALLDSMPQFAAAASTYTVCRSSIDDLCLQIKEIKTKDNECKIAVILHWGAEYAMFPSVGQRKQAYKLIDAGADVVIGHHPHVIQEPEIYSGKYIFYSLGNFIFDGGGYGSDKGLLAGVIFTQGSIEVQKYYFDIKHCVPRLTENK
ncbi:MAG: CapA family protein [Endomicrobia bacterium]|nr:CapA family protein [Endomicrobiia bacterium]